MHEDERAALRRDMRQRRRALDAARQREASLAVCAHLARQVAGTQRVTGDDAVYIQWATYPDGTTYLLNTDCVAPRTVRFDGRELAFAPKELKEVKP